MRFIFSLFSLFTFLCIYAGPHTIQRGESFASLAKLYNISLDTIVKSNPNTECYIGLTVDIPHSFLVYDLGNSKLFRDFRFRKSYNYNKGKSIYRSAYKNQLKLSKFTGEKKRRLEEKIVHDYTLAISFGNLDALFQLGKIKVHGSFKLYNGMPSFQQSINDNLKEFTEGIEYLQIATLLGNNSHAFVEMALACGYESSPIRNPYLCLSMLEQCKREQCANVDGLICYMYENGYGIKQDLLQAYLNCPTKELTENKGKTHRERILELIEAMPIGFESSKYGVGLKSDMLLSIGASKYHDDILDPEGLFWLHRSARLDNADANWMLASVIQNDNCIAAPMGNSYNKEQQIMFFVRKAANLGKQEAEEYLEAYEKQQEAKREHERQEKLKRRREKEERKQRRQEFWLNFAGAAINVAAQTYMAVAASNAQSYSSPRSAPSISAGHMSEAQWQAKNQLALQQIAQYTINKTYADWTGTPMVPTDMSAVDLGTDYSPGSPLWMWGQQQEINRMSTQIARMECERVAFYKRQVDEITRQLIENPLQPIAGYYDIDGNWISHEMVANGYLDENVSGYKAEKPISGEQSNNTDNLISKNKSYWSENYGYKDCPSCMGSGVCKTCNGKGYNYNSYGAQGSHECPNCFKQNGRSCGICGRCQGKRKIFGLKR
ncbi:MAG: hypothetical protein IKQ51_00995 [Bacteroidaceae bacterium]|nr:hypothetical protein [Bacteroidaceae bacterium]